MSAWTSADLLRRFKRAVGLADANEEDDATDLYPILSSAQQEVIREIATRYPACLYDQQGPTALTPSGDGKTFSFGTDGAGNPVLPMGWVQVSPRLSAFAGDDSYYWREGVDFLDEGTRIRIPGDRTYSGTLYGRWVPTPPDITASQEPILNPTEARALIVHKAVIQWGSEGNVRPDLVQTADALWARQFPVWMLSWRRRFRGGGALNDPARWWLTADFTTHP